MKVRQILSKVYPVQVVNLLLSLLIVGILFLVVFMNTGCFLSGGKKPVPQPVPTAKPDPEPDLPFWKQAYPNGMKPKKVPYDIFECWINLPDKETLMKVAPLVTGGEAGFFLDNVCLTQVKNGKLQIADQMKTIKGVKAWLATDRYWYPFGPVSQTCKFNMLDTLKAMQWTGLKIELNFDTSGAGIWKGGELHDNYHRGRLLPFLIDDEIYVMIIRNVLRALEQEGITVHEVTVENEPWCCPTREQEFTEAMYVKRAKRTKQMIDKLFPEILVTAGAVKTDWGIAAYKAGACDLVGYHALFFYEKSYTEAQERALHRKALKAFKDAGIPLSKVKADEVMSRRMRLTFNETLGAGIRCLSFVTITGCLPWASDKHGNFENFKDEAERYLP